MPYSGESEVQVPRRTLSVYGPPEPAKRRVAYRREPPCGFEVAQPARYRVSQRLLGRTRPRPATIGRPRPLRRRMTTLRPEPVPSMEATRLCAMAMALGTVLVRRLERPERETENRPRSLRTTTYWPRLTAASVSVAFVDRRVFFVSVPARRSS